MYKIFARCISEFGRPLFCTKHACSRFQCKFECFRSWDRIDEMEVRRYIPVLWIWCSLKYAQEIKNWKSSSPFHEVGDDVFVLVFFILRIGTIYSIISPITVLQHSSLSAQWRAKKICQLVSPSIIYNLDRARHSQRSLILHEKTRRFTRSRVGMQCHKLHYLAYCLLERGFVRVRRVCSVVLQNDLEYRALVKKGSDWEVHWG